MTLLSLWSIGLIIFNCFLGECAAQSKKAFIQGDILLGGLFPVHDWDRDKCGSLNPDRGVQRLEAMLYALDYIEEKKILPGIKLGAEIFDTCSFYHKALNESLRFVPIWNDKQKIRGVVGGAVSKVSVYVSNLMVLFKQTQISYASTSAILSDRFVHSLFARTVPSDVQQAKAMAEVVAYHNWTYVSTVKSAGSYGEPGMKAFIEEAAKLNICISVKETIQENAERAAVRNIVIELEKESDKAKVVVLFISMTDAALLLDVIAERKLKDRFIFISSDGWGREKIPVNDKEDVANGAITIEIEAEEVPEFAEYFKSLRLPNTRNPWFRDYWNSLFNCNAESKSEPSCSKNSPDSLRERLPANFKSEAKVKFILDAVFTFAYALRHLQVELCDKATHPISMDKCINLLNNYSGDEFYKILTNNEIQKKYNSSFRFDKNGDGIPKYGIYNFIRDPSLNTYVYKKIGRYDNGVLTMTDNIWPNELSNSVPESRCSKDCSLGFIRKYSKEIPCCWNCEACQTNQIITNNTCVDCDVKFWPSENREKCIERKLIYIGFKKWFGIVPTIVSVLGIIFCLFVLVIFIIFRDTPMVKASGRELSSILLAGCLICYLITFTIISKPNIISCVLQRIGVGLGFTCMYAAMLTKTSRLHRIFDAAKRTTKRPVFVSPRSQLVIVASFIGLQVLLSTIWFVYDPPNVNEIDRGDDGLLIKCDIQSKSFMINLIYNIFLITFCTYYAIKTRTVPENFNESKYIGFTMYTTCIIWLAFLAIYFATVNNSEIQDLTLCISVSLSASVTLICMFSPKLYIILFRPELNVRKLTMNNTSASQISRTDTTYVHKTINGAMNNISKEDLKAKNDRYNVNFNEEIAIKDDESVVLLTDTSDPTEPANSSKKNTPNPLAKSKALQYRCPDSFYNQKYHHTPTPLLLDHFEKPILFPEIQVRIDSSEDDDRTERVHQWTPNQPVFRENEKDSLIYLNDGTAGDKGQTITTTMNEPLGATDDDFQFVQKPIFCLFSVKSNDIRLTHQRITSV